MVSRLRGQGTQVGSDEPEPPAYLIQAGNETRGRAGEAKALLDGGEAALEVGAVQELAELQKAMAEHEHLREDTSAAEDPGQRGLAARLGLLLFPVCFLTCYFIGSSILRVKCHRCYTSVSLWTHSVRISHSYHSCHSYHCCHKWPQKPQGRRSTPW